jgi:hypothetical protein
MVTGTGKGKALMKAKKRKLTAEGAAVGYTEGATGRYVYDELKTVQRNIPIPEGRQASTFRSLRAAMLDTKLIIPRVRFMR